MKGYIKEINWAQNQVAVQTESQDFTVFEIVTGDEFSIGDTVEWIENNPLGHSKITNLTTKEETEVFFQNHYVIESDLKKMLLY